MLIFCYISAHFDEQIPETCCQCICPDVSMLNGGKYFRFHMPINIQSKLTLPNPLASDQQIHTQASETVVESEEGSRFLFNFTSSVKQKAQISQKYL